MTVKFCPYCGATDLTRLATTGIGVAYFCKGCKQKFLIADYPSEF